MKVRATSAVGGFAFGLFGPAAAERVAFEAALGLI